MSKNSEQSSKAPVPTWLIYLGLASIVIATLVAYMPAMRAGFIWDDDSYVSDNHLLRNFSGLGKIWSLRVGTAPDGRQYLVSHTPQYYPLVFSTFWLESRLWGQSNPAGFHVVNILLHIANALLVWRICHRLGFGWAYLAALIFALHPVEVESVAWITERKNVLSGLFYLLALLAYLRFDTSGKKRFYFTALGCFVLALLSKTVTCTLPVILLLILWLRHRRLSWSDLARLVPFFAVGAVFGLFTAYLERYKVGAVGAEWEIAFWQRWIIAGKAVFFYAWKLVWPSNLTFIYPRWDPRAFSSLSLLWPSAVIVLTAALWFLRRSIGRSPLTAWAGFIITLFPALGFFDVFPFRFSFVADHFQYLASIFLIVLSAGLLHGLYKRFWPQALKISAVPAEWISLTVIISFILGYLTYAQAATYKDLESLWDHTIRNNSGAWMAWNNRGSLYLDKGNFDQAFYYFNKAIELNSMSPLAHNGRGGIYLRRGDNDRAISDLDRAIRLEPRYAEAYSDRGLAYSNKGDNDRAIRDLNRAIELDSTLVEAYNNRGVAYGRKGDNDQAIQNFEKAIDLDPRSAEAYSNRGIAYYGKGDYDRAIHDFSEAIRLNPKYAPAYQNRAVAYRSTGDDERAMRDLDTAERLRRQNPRFQR